MPYVPRRVVVGGRRRTVRRPARAVIAKKSMTQGRFMAMTSRTRVPSKVHLFKRMANVIEFVSKGTAVTLNDISGAIDWVGPITDDSNTQQFGFSYTAWLNQVIQTSEFTSLFDRYKILGVKLKCMYQTNVGAYGSTGPLPILYSAYDADDNTVPANQIEVQAKGYCKTKILNGNKMFSLYFKPRIDKAVYQSGATFAYSSERVCWLDCANTSVPHYAQKFWIRNFPVAEDGSKLTIQPTFYLALKDTQ